MENDSEPPPERRSPLAPDGPPRPVRGPLLELLRWIGRHVRGFYSAVGAFLALGLLVTVAGLWGFALLARQVAHGRTRVWDEGILLWMHQHASESLTIAALEVTALGAGPVVALVIAISSIFLWLSDHRYSVALLWVALLGSVLINTSLKEIFDRPRPELFPWRTPYAGHASFPSGHSMTAMVVYATLAYLVARLEATTRLRRLTYASAAVLILLIGASRVYLGVHYPSDVLAGFLSGMVWAYFCALGIEAVRHFRGRNPDVEENERDLDGAGAGRPAMASD